MPTRPTLEPALSFLDDSSAMSARIRAFDWSATLGPVEHWPQSLKTAVGFLVRSPLPIVLLWGPDGIMLYNDGYAHFAGRRHPQLLGSKVLEGWPEVAEFNANVMRVVMAGGTLSYQDRELALDRQGAMERVWLDLGYSPVIAEDGQAGGVIAIVVETTQRVLAQRRADSERDRLAQMFAQAPSFMALLEGPEHRFRLTNPGYDRLIGGRRVVGLPVAEALPEVVGQGFVQVLDRVYQSGEPFSALGAKVALHYASVDQLSTRYLDFVYQPVTGDDGRTAGIFVQGVDVTERVLDGHRKEALAALTESLSQLNEPAQIVGRAAEVLGTTLAASRSGYATVIEEARTVRIDHDWTAPGFASCIGTHQLSDYGSAGLIDELKRGRTVVVPDVHTDERTRAHAAAFEALRIGSLINVPVIEQQRLVALLFVHDEDARQRSAEDIALVREFAARTRTAVERERAARALRVADGRFRFLDELNRQVGAAHGADAILALTTRLTGEYMKVSICAYADLDEDQDGFTIRGDWGAPGMASIVGRYRLSDFGAVAVERLRHGLPLIVNDNLREVPPAEAATYQAMGIAATICIPLVKGGRLEALMAVHDARPRPWTIDEIALIREVTERSWAHVERVAAEAEQKQAQLALSLLNATLEQRVQDRTSQLVETEEALRQAQKMEAVGQLTGGIAHDFNNLLHVIGGSLSLIERRVGGDDAAAQRYLTTARGAVQRAASLTHRLLAFSRRQTLDPKPTEVDKLVHGMEELIRRSVGPGVAVQVAGAAGLWITKVDPSQLESALLNLCINGRDAMAPNGGVLKIASANRTLDTSAAAELGLKPGEYVALSVTDTGAGMTEDVIKRAFDPFFTTKPIGQGTGLGLSMVYGFVRQSGGEVHIDSVPGRGTTLTLFLPRDRTAPRDDAQAPAPLHSPGGTGETILVVDEEAAIRLLISDVLREAGYAVVEAGTGAEGLRQLQGDGPVDLLITDVGLPGGMNGRQLADAARTTRARLKVLFITGYAERAVLDGGHLESGMDVMTKPFDITRLAARVQAILDRR